MLRIVFSLCLTAAVLPWAAPAVSLAEQGTPEQLEFFERRVRPLLVAHCYECHSGDAAKLQADLRLDHRGGLLKGGESGPTIVPGDAEASMFIEAIRYESYEMPPKGKLSDDEIEVFVQWINSGAAWPDEPPPASAESVANFDIQQRRAEHWAWQPLAQMPPPEVQQSGWPTTAIDHFILHELEKAGLSPAEPVDRRALIRRLSFDLVGLPPRPDQVEAFVNDKSPASTERLVDSLLQSPLFGERWGRHWLDLVRYAESRGHEFDNDAQNAFQYRDYIIRALNADVPHDQLIREHLAGDLLSHPRLNTELGFNESILGTGFWFLGEWIHSPVDIRKDEADRFDNMIDVMSKAFLGMTVACARCHDHKFDAISMADYYALSGFLQSSDYRQVRFETLEQDRQTAEELAELDNSYRSRISERVAAHARHPAAQAGAQRFIALIANDQASIPLQASTPDAEELSGTQSEPEIRDRHILVDYASIAQADYLQDGHRFGPAPRCPGDLIISKTDDGPRLQIVRFHAAATDPFWAGLKSISGTAVQQNDRLSSIAMSGQTLRTPTVLLQAGDVACRVRGRGHIIACVDSHRLIAGPLHGETIQKFDTSGNWQWTSLNLNRYVGHRLHFEFVADDDASLEVAVITQGASPEQLTQLQRRQSNLAQSAENMQHFVDQLLGDTSDATAEIRGLVAAWADQRQSLRHRVRDVSRLAIVMADGTGEDDHILIRGNAANPGPAVSRRFLSAIDGEGPLEITSRSGRLELANRINDPANPLAPRVIVNRIWHLLMGRGIVATTDDFGVLGQRPTHPQLLDHLAARFLHDERSIKRMIRYIVLSKTYQMSSLADAVAVAEDPKNLLWHHRPPKRLEGEAIRDQLLAVSGRLDAALYGEPIPIHLTTFMEGRGRPARSGPLDGDGRRSLYIAVRRNFLSPFMLAFDTPVPFSTMGRRNVSNVPAQSLILMNDPFVVSQAAHWARQVLAQPAPAEREDAVASRVTRMYQAAFARPPHQEELAAAEAFLPGPGDSTMSNAEEVSRWTDFAHTLINTKEFIFLR